MNLPYRRQRFSTLVAAAAAVVVALAGSAQAQDTAIKLGMGVNYSTGDYGTGQDVDIWSVPFTADLETGRWSLGLVVPYIVITSAGDVVGGTDAPVVTKKKKNNQNKRTTESGLGDIVMSAGYAVLPGYDGAPFVELVGKVKFPTASDSKSLGTGEFDYTFLADMSQTMGKLTPFATLGYRINGDPEGTDLNNIFLASIGAVFELSEGLSAGAALDYRQATVDSADASLEISPYVSLSIRDAVSLDFNGVLGLTDGSPDIGGGLQLTITF